MRAPLYEKPVIGSNPFTPMEGSRPDRTSDAVKEIMKGIALLYDNSTRDHVFFEELLKEVSLHRLTLDKSLGIAVDRNLIYVNMINPITITISIQPAGIDYLIEHNIIEG